MSGLYVPAQCRDWIGNPDVILMIADNPAAADHAAQQLGMCAVSIDGPWGWRDNKQRPDGSLEDLALNDRSVEIAFDRAVWADKDGNKGLTKLIQLLQRRGAMPPERLLFPEGKGLRDYTDLDDLNDVDHREIDGAYPGDNGGRSEYIDRDGLLARKLAEAVMESVTCGFSEDEKCFYTYRCGLWSPGSAEIECEIVTLLGDRHRHGHTTSVLDVIQHHEGTRRITKDPQPQHINVANGMLDWKTETLHKHSPAHGSTVQLPLTWNPAADCPVFAKFLAEVLPADCLEPCDGGPGFIWELIGYLMYSGNPLHIAVLLYGKGRNGKGTLLRLLKALLGHRNLSSVGLHDLTENRFRSAQLHGKLANLAGDLDSRWIENTASFKAITGNDVVMGEHKYGTPFDFTPWAVPVYSTNKAFGSADSSEGWNARWVIVGFPNCFTGHEDRELDAKLATDAELSGIARRGIEGLQALMARGQLPQPPSLVSSKNEFIASSDAVRAWIDEHAMLEFDAWTPRTELYTAYRQQNISSGSKLLSDREFYNRIEQVRGIHPRKSHGTRGFEGIRLRRQCEVSPDEDGPTDSTFDGIWADDLASRTQKVFPK